MDPTHHVKIIFTLHQNATCGSRRFTILSCPRGNNVMSCRSLEIKLLRDAAVSIVIDNTQADYMPHCWLLVNTIITSNFPLNKIITNSGLIKIFGITGLPTERNYYNQVTFMSINYMFFTHFTAHRIRKCKFPIFVCFCLRPVTDFFKQDNPLKNPTDYSAVIGLRLPSTRQNSDQNLFIRVKKLMMSQNIIQQTFLMNEVWNVCHTKQLPLQTGLNLISVPWKYNDIH